MKNKQITWTSRILIILAVAAFFLPMVNDNPYFLHICIVIFIWSILTLGIRIVLLTGHLNAAQGGFMGMGAYFSAVLTMKMGFSFWISLPLSAIGVTLLAIIIGFPILRIKGAYFVMITFGVTEVFRQIWMLWKDVFGGPEGLFGVPKPTPIDLFGLEISFTSKTSIYYLAFIALFITVIVMRRIDHSRLGMILRSFPQAEPLSESVGISIRGYKLLAFAIGSFFAGIGGTIWAHYFTYASPFDYTFTNSLYMLMYAAIGGSQTVLGPIVGCIALLGLDEYLGEFEHYTPIILGVILIFVLLYLPGGLITLPERIKGLFYRRTQ